MMRRPSLKNATGPAAISKPVPPDPFAHHLRLKKPCSNCPFLVHGAIELVPGRVQGILDDLLSDDTTTFQCHKTVHHAKGGDWDEDGKYEASGNEAMCAGAAAVLMKQGRPTVAMRFAFTMGKALPTQWDGIADKVI